MDHEISRMAAELDTLLDPARESVIRPATGYLKYPYLIPAGYYSQMWDWDAFFMGCHFMERGQPEYLKYWTLNLLAGVDEEGYTAGCATIEGPRPIFGRFSMKPFLSQGAWLASNAMEDFSWLEPHYTTLEKVLEYRDKTQLDTEYGLYFWESAMQSGADNNPALNYFQEDERSFVSCDASAFQHRELKAQARLAEALGRPEDAAKWTKRADDLREAMLKHLWCEEDQIFYNIDRDTKNWYRRVSYSSFIPLFDQIAPMDAGREMIQRYLVNPEHMKAEFGLRSLSLCDPDYNNRNIINPFSNWQGPVWPIANYLYSIALHHYGFHDENKWLAKTLGELLIKDLHTHGTMHENYHADTGAPLAPSDEFRTEDGKIVGFVSWNLCIQNILDGVTKERWMLLEIN